VDPTRIAAIDFFAGLPEWELDAVASSATALEVGDGQPIVAAGDFGHALFAVESGTAAVMSDGAVVRAVGPGDVVGEVAVLASGRRTASVVATSPMSLVVLYKRDVWALEQRAPEAARRLRGVLAEHRASPRPS
jgi:monovalent cation:H+ antiporter, CPA1 family